MPDGSDHSCSKGYQNMNATNFQIPQPSRQSQAVHTVTMAATSRIEKARSLNPLFLFGYRTVWLILAAPHGKSAKGAQFRGRGTADTWRAVVC